MTNPEEREQESRTSEEDKFTEAHDEEREERSELAQNIQQNELDENGE